MDEKTRQRYFRFLQFLTESDFESLDQKKLQLLDKVADELLKGTELFDDVQTRVNSAMRFLESSERGAANFEIKQLHSGVTKRLDK